MSLALRFAARSHTGLLRTGNEDSAYAGPRLLAVADGMGGAAAGEVASAVAVASLASLDEDAPGSDLLGLLRERATAANDRLREMVSGNAELDGMGTTLTAFLFAGSRMGIVHVGDSRAYLLRDGALTQITRDDTFVQTLVDDGRISPAEASSHPQRNLITRALDGRDDVELSLSVREVRAGDRYLVCSDGLTGPVGRESTLHKALELDDLQESVDQLVQLALRGGGPDNITVVVADVVDTPGTAAQRVAVVAGAAADSPQSPLEGVDTSSAARARTAEGRDVAPPRPVRADAVPEPPRRRRRLLTALVGLGLLAVVAGAGVLYVRSLYYVGVHDERVAIFRGVDGSLAGVPFHTVAQTTSLPTSRLDALGMERVQAGIDATGLTDAERIVENLKNAAGCGVPLPLAPSPLPSPGPTGQAPTPRPAPAGPSPAPTVAALAQPSPAQPSPAAAVDPCAPS